MKRLTILLLLAVALGCTTATTPSPTAPPAPRPAPWAGAKLAAAQVPAVYRTEWRNAQNRTTCALIAPASLGVPEATPRSAYFAGGWAVAYDTPDQRSAFGIAGTGSRASDPAYDEWPHKITWEDGSSAGYGPEGGTGPKQLAYLRIAGQDCLYNVWSGVSREHLEALLGELRFVEVSAAR
ncbi:MAG TPA: hypothetical protein VF618_28770 [Thermoanaerobaculia bacterium]